MTHLAFNATITLNHGTPPFSVEPEVELRGHGQPLFWGDAAQGHVWAVMIIGPHPTRCVVLHVGKRIKLILRQPFVTHRPVEAFDVGILLWLAGLDEVDPDARFSTHP